MLSGVGAGAFVEGLCAAHLVYSDVEVCVHVALLPFEVLILIFVHLEIGNIRR